MLFSNIDIEYKEILDEVVEWRRYLHERPELSFKEEETATYISSILQEIPGIKVSRPTKTSVMGRLDGSKKGNTIAVRADIDALPIHEEVNVPFKSKNFGVMHACGHDGHTAILLGLAKILSELSEKLAGNFVFIFQHAEEVPPGGAREMVKANVLEGVDYVLGLHLWSTIPVGELLFTPGAMTAASDTFDIQIHGAAGHASQPDIAIDPIVIGSEIVSNLQQIISRKISPFEQGVISVTRFHSGDAYNVIPDKAVISGSVRALQNDVRELIKSELETISTYIGKAHGAEVTVNYEYGYNPIVNDSFLYKEVMNVTENNFSTDKVIKVKEIPPGLGGEDFSAFTQEKPGLYIGVGARIDEPYEVFPHHHPKVMINEKAFPIAIKYLLSTVLHLSKIN